MSQPWSWERPATCTSSRALSPPTPTVTGLILALQSPSPGQTTLPWTHYCFDTHHRTTSPSQFCQHPRPWTCHAPPVPPTPPSTPNYIGLYSQHSSQHQQTSAQAETQSIIMQLKASCAIIDWIPQTCACALNQCSFKSLKKISFTTESHWSWSQLSVSKMD